MRVAIPVKRLVPVAFVSGPTTQFFVPLPLPRSEPRLFTVLLQVCSTSVRFKGPHPKYNGESRKMKEKKGTFKFKNVVSTKLLFNCTTFSTFEQTCYYVILPFLC